MRKMLWILVCAMAAGLVATPQEAVYYPGPREEWEHRKAESVKGGVNLDHFGGAKVDQLVKG